MDALDSRRLLAWLTKEELARLKLKPAYYALKRLLKETWTTEWRGTAASGAASFRGFYGDYEVEVPGYRKAAIAARSAGSKSVTVKLLRAP